MGRKPKVVQVDAIEEAIENAIVKDTAVPADDNIMKDVDEANTVVVPDIGTEAWQEYVISMFNDSDKDPEGNPTADACRIVASRLLGPIVFERVRTVSTAEQSNDYRATVEVSIGIAWGGDREDVRVFEDVADVYPLNSDPIYARFPSASAKTKAMGRAYKAALMLKRVYTAEELATKEVPKPTAELGDLIPTTYQKFIAKICRELNINVDKFINSGKSKYSSITQVQKDKSEQMIKLLNKYQQDTNTIPVEIKGYETREENRT